MNHYDSGSSLVGSNLCGLFQELIITLLCFPAVVVVVLSAVDQFNHWLVPVSASSPPTFSAPTSPRGSYQDSSYH